MAGTEDISKIAFRDVVESVFEDELKLWKDLLSGRGALSIRRRTVLAQELATLVFDLAHDRFSREVARYGGDISRVQHQILRILREAHNYLLRRLQDEIRTTITPGSWEQTAAAGAPEPGDFWIRAKDILGSLDDNRLAWWAKPRPAWLLVPMTVSPSSLADGLAPHLHRTLERLAEPERLAWQRCVAQGESPWQVALEQVRSPRPASSEVDRVEAQILAHLKAAVERIVAALLGLRRAGIDKDTLDGCSAKRTQALERPTTADVLEARRHTYACPLCWSRNLLPAWLAREDVIVFRGVWQRLEELVRVRGIPYNNPRIAAPVDARLKRLWEKLNIRDTSTGNVWEGDCPACTITPSVLLLKYDSKHARWKLTCRNGHPQEDILRELPDDLQDLLRRTHYLLGRHADSRGVVEDIVQEGLTAALKRTFAGDYDWTRASYEAFLWNKVKSAAKNQSALDRQVGAYEAQVQVDQERRANGSSDAPNSFFDRQAGRSIPLPDDEIERHDARLFDEALIRVVAPRLYRCLDPSDPRQRELRDLLKRAVTEETAQERAEARDRAADIIYSDKELRARVNACLAEMSSSDRGV